MTDQPEQEITRLRAQIEQERAVQTRLNEEVSRLEALLHRAKSHLLKDPPPDDDWYKLITEIEALK